MKVVVWFFFFFDTRHKKWYKGGYIIKSECNLLTLTKNFEAVIVSRVTFDRMIFGADLIWIWSPWLCWRAFRSSKIRVRCHLYLLLRLHVVKLEVYAIKENFHTECNILPYLLETFNIHIKLGYFQKMSLLTSINSYSCSQYNFELN